MSLKFVGFIVLQKTYEEDLNFQEDSKNIYNFP
jgi:hypothetical protein